MTGPADATLEAVIRRDRIIVVTALSVVIALPWAYLLAGAGMGMSALETTRMLTQTHRPPGIPARFTNGFGEPAMLPTLSGAV